MAGWEGWKTTMKTRVGTVLAVLAMAVSLVGGPRAGAEVAVVRAEVEVMIARADEAMYEARLVLDRMLAEVTLAPRPVIMLPA